MTTDQTRNLAYELRLFGVQESLEKRAAQAAGQGLNHLEFLRLILEDESLNRKNRASKKLILKAKFRSAADIEDWDQSFERGLTKAKVREIASLSFIDSAENLLLLGRTGEGKTHLAVAIGRRLCAENISTLFLPVNFLFEEVAAARSTGKYLNYIKKLTSNRAIILDDFGLRN
jgi:DNA replication protein DnaC